jgi:CRISPR-associated protein Csm1
MKQNYTTAIAVYEEALALLARRANSTSGVELRPLQSIPGQLFAQQSGHVYTGYYKPQAMRNEAALPLAEPPMDLLKSYQALWEEIENAQPEHLNDRQDPVVREANLHALLQRCAWAVPAPDAQDVSLYDHARTQAALAVCSKDEAATDQEAVLLVGADLSGVQDWLYTLSSAGAARSLRGRSVYLQLLMEVIALDLLAHLNLPSANLLYVGGGNFYILAPVSTKAAIEEYRRLCSQQLLAMHGGALYVAVDYASLSQGTLDGTRGKISDAWEQVNRVLNVRKGKRFSELEPLEMARAIGSAMDDPGRPEKICRVCQRPIGDDEYSELVDEDGVSDERKCGLCVSLQDLGGKLSSADYLVLSRVEQRNTEDVCRWEDGLAQFGFDVQIVKVADNQRSRHMPPSNLTRVYYWKEGKGRSDFPRQTDPLRTVWSFRPLAQCVPLDKNGETMTFREIEKESQGLQRWGVLRMDVDDLGTIFQHGLPQSSLAHVVGLSALMRLFFEGYVPHLAQEFNQDNHHRIHLMYAGGDDLFVVGAWSYLPELAAKIREAFSEFACHNPNLSISGGISIALAEKYPLYQAARDASEAEDQAKAYKGAGGDKNALTFLGETMTWAEGTDQAPIYNSYGWVSGRVQDLTEWLGGPEAKLPRSFLQVLRSIDGEWREWIRQERGKKAKQGYPKRYDHGKEPEVTLYLGPWQWHLVYSLKRAAEKKEKGMQESIEQLVQHIVNGEIRSIGFASRWAEFWLRDSE